VVGIELNLSLERGHVLSMDLVSEGPEVTFPNETGLGVLQSQVVFLIDTLRCDAEVEIGDVEPIRNDEQGGNVGPHLEPTFRVDIVDCPIGVTLEGSPNWESVRGVLLCKH